MPSNDEFRKIAPASDGSFALITSNSERSLVALLGINVELDVQDDDRSKIPHSLFGDS